MEIIFADDLNAYRAFDRKTPNGTILRTSTNCQTKLHEWGHANAITFDGTKESTTILSRNDPHGDGFKMYGIKFDPGLYMSEAVNRLYSEASWKLSSILRTSRFFSTGHIVYLYKTKVMSYIEFRTAAIYHSSANLLQRIDGLQDRLLRSIGMNATDALTKFNLTPLQTRRDIALLGLIHRTVLGLGPDQFRQHFELAQNRGRRTRNRHSKQMVSHRKGKSSPTRFWVWRMCTTCCPNG